MSLAGKRRYCASAVLLALALGLFQWRPATAGVNHPGLKPASDSVSGQPSYQRGIPWRGRPGITETVEAIMARDPGPSVGEPREAPRHGVSLPREQNPESPAVSQWPPPAEGATVREPGALAPQTVGTSFLGAQLSESGRVPPDSMGDVGPTQLLVAVNGRIKVFDKTGTLGGLNTTLDNFFASVGGATNGTSDPHVRFDRLSGRWFVTAISIDAVNDILIARSSGSTITGASSFTFFRFQHDQVGPTPNADTGGFADYDTLGVDKFALYIGANIFSAAGQFSNTSAFVVDKADLITGLLTVTAFRSLINFNCASGGGGLYTPQGVDNDDPQATDGYFIGVDACLFGKLVVRRVVDPAGTPSLSGNLDVTVAATTLPQDQPQPAPGPELDAIDDRLFAAAVHPNKLTGARTLWTAHNIEVNSGGVADSTGNRNGSRWYEIGSLTTTPSLIQSGTLFDPSATTPFGFWIPSVAMSGQGHMALGSSRASADGTNGFASIIGAGRLRTDPLGTIQSPTLAQGSSFLYDTSRPSTERWGDYSQVGVDPNDDQTMWTFQEYANATNSWGVQVLQLRAPPPATPSSASPSSVGGGQASVNVVVTGTSTSGSEFFDPGPDTGGPGFSNHIGASVSGGVTVNSVTFNSPTQVTLNISTAGATSGTQTVTIINPDGQSSSGAILTVTGVPANVTLEPPADSNTVGTNHAVTATVEDSSGSVVPGASVSFTFSGTGGESPPSGSATTDEAGRAPFSFTSTKTGTSTITATSASAAGSATKTWTPSSPAQITLDPTTDSNTVGATHTVTATVKDQFGNLVANGTAVNFGVSGTGSETPPSGSANTVAGKASFGFTSTKVGQSTITASSGSVSATATKTWTADVPNSITLEPSSDTNTVNTIHTVTATVRDRFGNNVADGTLVNFTTSGTGGDSPSSGSANTLGGKASFSFSSSKAGSSTVVAVAGSASGTATKAWTCPPLAAPYFGFDIARDVAFLPGSNCTGYLLEGFGGIHPFGGAPPANGAPYFAGFDIARALVIKDDGTGGFVLDGYGGTHPFGIGGNPPPAKPAGGPYFSGFDIANDILLIGPGQGYILDGFGARHPFGGAPATTGGPYFPGNDIARAFDMTGGAGSPGYVLDGLGGRHPFNGAPASTGGPYFPGFDIARDIVLSGPSQGHVLDGYGSIHSFGGAPVAGGGPYFSGFDIANAFVLDARRGLVLDGFGGLHLVTTG